MPNLNKGNFIKAAIESVLAQSYANFELLVVDNGSLDQSVEVIQELARSDDRVHLVREPRRGISFAMNAGVRTARGSLVTFLGSDDVCHKGRLLQQTKAMTRDAPKVCYTEGWIIDVAGNPTGKLYNRDIVTLPEVHEGRIFHQLLRNDFVIGGSMMVAREHLGPEPFDESLGFAEDWDLLVRLASQMDFVYVPTPLYGYRIYSGNTWARGNERRFHGNYVKTFEKWLKELDGLNREDRSCILRKLLKSEEEIDGKVGMLQVAVRHPGAAGLLLGMVTSSFSRRIRRSNLS